MNKKAIADKVKDHKRKHDSDDDEDNDDDDEGPSAGSNQDNLGKYITHTTYKDPEGEQLPKVDVLLILVFIKMVLHDEQDKKKLCKADLEGPAFNPLLKPFHKNNSFFISRWMNAKAAVK
ncbi:hypothetical protein Tco_1186496 [Tanacetum coccineum]